MASRRTHCPECERASAVSIADLFASAYGEYFICAICGHLWMIPIGKDGPATGLRETSTKSQRVGVGSS